jgi:phosphomannomutase
MARRYFGTDGIRGRANGVITPELALRVGQAAGVVFRRGEHRHRVLIGKDTRLSGYMIETALVAGFTSVGMDVFQTGPMPTPAIAMLTRSMRCDLGVMISASHNPFDDNGIKLFGPDGFKITRECGSTAPEELCRKVREMRADIGIALDGDADRVLVADERGHIVDGDQLLAVIAESCKEDGRLAKPGVVGTVMSNLGLERHLGGIGLSLERTPVGDRYVLEHMREHGFNVGGEQSGHIILSDFTTTGDGFVAALQVLAVVKKQGQPVSKVCHRFDALPQVLKNVRYKSGKPLENAKVRSAIKQAQAKLDGQGRLVVRPSGTEPVIRVMVEGDDKGLVEEVVDGIVEALTQAAAA